MSDCLPSGAIHVKGISLWAHVGVLEHERLLGQLFNLDFSLWLDVDSAAKNDDLSSTYDYSLAIKNLQQLAFGLKSMTIEYFSEKILDCLEGIYGQVPMKVFLSKCSPPVEGFSGTVCIERSRYLPLN